MEVHCAFSNGKAKTCASCLSFASIGYPVERPKQVRDFLFRHSRAVVTNSDLCA